MRERVQVAARSPADDRRSADSGNPATWATVVIPIRWSRPAVTGPTPQSRSTGSGWRNASSVGGTTRSPSGFATALATLARNFVRATPTVIGRPTRSRTSRRSLAAISTGLPASRFHPAGVEERLVDREPLDERRRVLEDAEDGLARLRVRLHARRHDDRVRAEPAGAGRPSPCEPAPWPRSSRRARRPADDDRPAAQARVVALLDRGEERVQVGVEDGGLAVHEHMFDHSEPIVNLGVALRAAGQ